MRVASLTPSNTEIVAFLGLEDELVAVDSFSDWPDRVDGCVDLGPDLQIDVDRLAQLDLDLVLSSLTVPGMEAVVERVDEAGVPQKVVRPRSLEGIEASVVEVASELGVSDRGKRLAGAMRGERERIASLTGAREAPRVHWEWWPDPVIVAGPKGWMPGVLETAGARNAYAHLEAESPEVSVEEVQRVDPDVIALCWQGTLQRVQQAGRVLEREGFSGVRAVVEGRILERPEALYGRPGPRVVEGIRSLALALHPQLEPELGEAYVWVPGELARPDLT